MHLEKMRGGPGYAGRRRGHYTERQMRKYFVGEWFDRTRYKQKGYPVWLEDSGFRKKT